MQSRISQSLFRWYIFFIALSNLDQNNFATLAFTISVIEIIRVFSDFGFEPYLFIKIANGTKKPVKSWWVIASLKSIFSFIATILVAIYALLFENNVLLLSAILITTGTIILELQCLLQRKNNYKDALKVGLVNLIFLIILISQKKLICNILFLIEILIIFDILQIIVMLFATYSHIRSMSNLLSISSFKIFKIAKTTCALSMFTYVITLLTTLSQRLDAIIINPILGSASQAEFSTAYRLTEPFLQFFSILSLAIFLNNKGLTINQMLLKINSLNFSKWKMRYILISVFLAATSVYGNIFLQGYANLSRVQLMELGFIFITPVRVGSIIASSILIKLNRIKYVSIAALLLFVGSYSSIFFISKTSSANLVFAIYAFSECVNFLYQTMMVRRSVRDKPTKGLFN